MKQVVIYGIGAMGCLFGARLAPHTRVTLVGHWPEQLAALQNGPLHFIQPDGTEQTVQINAISTDDAPPPADLALILTKFNGTEAAARHAARILRPEGIAITLQNGLGSLDIIKRHLPAEQVCQGVTMLGAATDGPGRLRFGGDGPVTLAANPVMAAQLSSVKALFMASGLNTEISPDLDSLIWGKLAINAGINPLTALLRVRNGALPESTWARSLMHEAACEVETVAHAQGITLPFPDAAAQTESVARATAANKSSMLQDVLRGAETEIDAICGAVVRVGDELDLPVPVNNLLHRMVKSLEATQPFRLPE